MTQERVLFSGVVESATIGVVKSNGTGGKIYYAGKAAGNLVVSVAVGAGAIGVGGGTALSGATGQVYAVPAGMELAGGLGVVAGNAAVQAGTNFSKMSEGGGNSKIDDVINETFSGKGNITSKHTLSSDEALKLGDELLGSNYKEVGKPGSGVFEKVVGDKIYRFRIDGNSLTGNHPPNIPHAHVEILNKARKVIVNNHIPFKS